FSSRRRHTRFSRDWSSDVCSSDLFYPFGHFFYRSTTDVSGDVRLTFEQCAKLQEFMCTEAVVFNHSAPVGIYHFRTLFAWTYTVAPMVFISETASRPAQIGNFNLFKSIDDIVSVTIFFRD